VNGSDTICDVKYSAEEKLGIPSNFQKFRFGGRQLIDHCSLTDQKIHQESTLQLFLHLRGGMHNFRSIRMYATIYAISAILWPKFCAVLSFCVYFVCLLAFVFFCLLFLQNNAMKTIAQTTTWHMFVRKKPAGEESSSEALAKSGTSTLEEDVQDKPINQVFTTKDANGRSVAEITDDLGAAVVPRHEKECTESAQEMFEDLTRRDGTEKQPHVKSPIDFDLPRASAQEMFEDLTRRHGTEKQPHVKSPIDFDLPRASAQEMFEDLTRRDGKEKEPHVKSPIDFDLPRACKTGQNDTKAELFAKQIRGLHSAVAEELPPHMLFAKEHCSMNTFTSRSVPADLLVSLCMAIVRAGVTVSNIDSLLSGDCWVIQGQPYIMCIW